MCISQFLLLVDGDVRGEEGTGCDGLRLDCSGEQGFVEEAAEPCTYIFTGEHLVQYIAGSEDLSLAQQFP